eukprot:symbB.v1.2.037358.t1/scaffold5495.1/size26502/3
MPTRNHGKKTATSKQQKKKEVVTAKQDVQAKQKNHTLPVSRLQLAACAAASFGAAGAYVMWTKLSPSKMDVRPMPTVVLPREGQAASSFTLTNSVPGCTIERGYANRHIVGPERFGVSSPKECMKHCRESSCNCWSWKDDGFCRTGTAKECTYIASDDDDRWMYGSCIVKPVTPTMVPLEKVPEMPFNPELKMSPVVPMEPTSESKGAKGVTPQPAPVVLDGSQIQKSGGAGVSKADAAAAPKADAVAEPKPDPSVCPVLMITHKRAEYLKRSLTSLFRHRTRPETYPIIASQDGDDAAVKAVLERYQANGQLKFLQFAPKTFLPSGYKRLSAHYAWALAQIFDVSGFQQAIILEEDLEIAVDFFSYFEATLPLLRADRHLFCVSAWNDNGRSDLVKNATAIYRTDFFPGLGWMLLSSFWNELKGKWPSQYWDDFVRRADNRLERHCLRPEVSRTHTFGEKGVSQGQYYKQLLVRKLAAFPTSRTLKGCP